MAIQLTILTIFLQFALIFNRQAVAKQELHVIGLAKYDKSHPYGHSHQALLQGALMAIEDINNRTDLLADYKLVVDYQDYRGNPALAGKLFVKMVQQKPIKCAILGPFESAGSETVASMARYWNLIQISSGATSANIVTNNNYPYIFTATINDLSFNLIRRAIIHYYNWTNIAVIMQTTKTFYLSGGQNFIQGLHKNNITVIAEESFTDQPERSVESMKKKNARILFVFADDMNTVKILCKAYELMMYGRNYAYFLLNVYRPLWLSLYAPYSNCTLKDLQTVANNYFMLTPFFGYLSNPIIVSGRTFHQHEKAYSNFVKKAGNTLGYARVMYDSVYALAMALNRTEKELRVVNRSLSDFTYNDSHTSGLIFKFLQEIQFLGASGSFRFYGRSRLGNAEIYQYQNLSASEPPVRVGMYQSLEQRLTMYHEKIRWEGGTVPFDKFRIEEDFIVTRLSTFYGFLIASFLGILLALFFLGFNIMKRNDRYIKMSSPRINNLFLIGCILCYMSVVISVSEAIDTNSQFSPIICPTRVWVLSIGFTLAFGSLFSKMWRVYKIFTNKTAKSIVIKDSQLFSLTLMLVCIDLILLCTWQIVDSLAPKWIDLPHIQPTGHSNVIKAPKMLTCTCDNIAIWVGALFAYKFLLLIFGTFLSWETRNVTIAALNDSYYIGLSIYNVIVFCTIGFLINVLIPMTPQYAYVVIGIFVNICTTFTVCLVFVPKIRRKPNIDIISSSTISPR